MELTFTAKAAFSCPAVQACCTFAYGCVAECIHTSRRCACRLMSKLDFEGMKFSLLFLGMTPPESVPEDPKDRVPPLGVMH